MDSIPNYVNGTAEAHRMIMETIYSIHPLGLDADFRLESDMGPIEQIIVKVADKVNDDDAFAKFINRAISYVNDNSYWRIEETFDDQYCSFVRLIMNINDLLQRQLSINFPNMLWEDCKKLIGLTIIFMEQWTTEYEILEELGETELHAIFKCWEQCENTLQLYL